MKMKNIMLTTTLLASLSTSTVALAKAPSWDQIGLDYFSVDIDDTDFEPSGFAVSASKLINENVYIHGLYRYVEDDVFGDELEISTLNLGLGYRHELNATTDLFAHVSYLNAEAEYDGYSEDDNGYTLGAGIKSMLSENFEGLIEITRESLDGESDTAFKVGAAYFINEKFSVGVGYEIADDANLLSIGVRFHF